MQQKITYAGTVNRSFAEGSDLLGQLAELSVSAKQVERIARRIGTERVAERDAEVAAYQALPLAEKFALPKGVKAPDLAVVMADGGRLQILDRLPRPPADPAPTGAGTVPAGAGDEAWDEEKPPAGHWREDKVGLLLTMHSRVSAADSCLDLPSAFVDASRIPELVRELSRQAKQAEDIAEPAATPTPAADPPLEEVVYQPPQVQQRKVGSLCQGVCAYLLENPAFPSIPCYSGRGTSWVGAKTNPCALTSQALNGSLWPADRRCGPRHQGETQAPKLKIGSYPRGGHLREYRFVLAHGLLIHKNSFFDFFSFVEPSCGSIHLKRNRVAAVRQSESPRQEVEAPTKVVHRGPPTFRWWRSSLSESVIRTD